MKYWLFENGDVVGPFLARELSVREGFGPHSLVCPEDRGEDDSAWKEAHLYEDFALAAEAGAFAVSVVSDPDKKDVFEEELSTLLEEKNPLSAAEHDSPREEPAENLHFPSHAPAKPGPIEDYFNNIKGEDLGNILGIPDPNENSDMNLARALESQFSQTQPPQKEETSGPLEDDPFDAFTAKEDLDDDLTPEDGLAAVAPPPDGGAPVVLAEKPDAAKDKPRRKFRIRKKHAPAETASSGGAAGNVSAASAPEPAPEKPDEDLSAAKTPEKSSAGEAVNAPPAASAAVQPVAEPDLKEETPRDISAQTAPVVYETVPEPEPAEPETEELDSIPLSVSDEPLPLLLKNPAELKSDRREADRAAEMKLREETVLLGQPDPAVPQAEPDSKEYSAPADSLKTAPSERRETAAPEQEQPQSPADAPNASSTEISSAPEPDLPALPAVDAPPETAVRSAQDVPAAQAPETAQPEEKLTPTKVDSSAEQAESPAEEKKPSPRPQASAGGKKEIKRSELSARPKTQDPVDEIMQGAVRVEDSPEVKEPIKHVEPVVAPRVNRVKPTLKKTAEIDQFLTEKVVPADPPPSKSKKMIWLALALLCLLAAFVWQWRSGRTELPQPPEPQAMPLTREAAAVDELMPAAEPDLPTAREALSLPAAPKAPELSAADRARQIVQNYELPDFNGKVSDYFDRIYKDKLAQGYSAAWSAEPLHKNVYIVKYRLSKTRSEPVVYLFQVDVAKNKLVGALNNITLDLVGKIK